MKTSLSHLPDSKQEQIRHITEIIKEVAKPEKIILFGSYAKGNYVEHSYTGRDGIRYEYVSDYDFLVVTKNNVIKEYELDDLITNKARRYRPPTNVEIHEIDYINEGLGFGQYFFTDIIREGILLYDKGTVDFSEPKELTRAEAREISKRYFDTWFPRGTGFLNGVKYYLQEGELKIGAFTLHQAAESFYYTALLVFTGYKPKTHNLAKLRKQAKHLSEELHLIFPVEATQTEKHLFELLKRGYVDARYRDDYSITHEELRILIEKVTKMMIVVERISKEKIASFQS